MMAAPQQTARQLTARKWATGSRFRLLATILVVVCVSVSGCHRGARRTTEVLETRIRNQEETIASLRRNATTLKAERDIARREADAIRSTIEKPDHPVMLAEHAETQLRVSTISISKLLSGGLDRDSEHGDELLNLLVVPTDESGETLRASGILEINAVDFAAPAGQQQIGHWKYDRNQTRDLWHAGLIGKGIQVTVPWQKIPGSKTVTVHARLTLPGGRQFDTTESLRVQPPATPVVGSRVSEDPLSSYVGKARVDLDTPLLPDFEAQRVIGLTDRRWQSTR
jgi:hypothetical protein